MNDPLRVGAFAGVVPQGGVTRPAGSGFAARLASGVVATQNQGTTPTVSGSSVIGAARGNAPGALSSQALLPDGSAATPEQAQALDLLDKTRTLVMSNMIFDAGNMPTVELDRE